MVKLVTVLFGIVLTNTAFAVIPANTELPITSIKLQKFVPDEDRPAVFRIEASKAQGAAGEAARHLAGCTLEGIAHLEAKPQRIAIKNAHIKCPTEPKNAKRPHEAHITGQILGTDHRTGLRITCKYQPLCSVATLGDGETGFFLTSKPLN